MVQNSKYVCASALRDVLPEAIAEHAFEGAVAASEAAAAATGLEHAPRLAFEAAETWSARENADRELCTRYSALFESLLHI